MLSVLNEISTLFENEQFFPNSFCSFFWVRLFHEKNRIAIYLMKYLTAVSNVLFIISFKIGKNFVFGCFSLLVFHAKSGSLNKHRNGSSDIPY